MCFQCQSQVRCEAISDSKTDELEGYDEGSYETEFISAGSKKLVLQPIRDVHALGIRGRMLLWLIILLKHRNFRVRFDGHIIFLR